MECCIRVLAVRGVFTLVRPPVGTWPLYVEEFQGYMLDDRGAVLVVVVEVLVVCGYANSYYACGRSCKLHRFCRLQSGRARAQSAFSVCVFFYLMWYLR